MKQCRRHRQYRQAPYRFRPTMKANPSMSQESSRSRGNIIDRAAVALDYALSRMLGSMRGDCDRAIGAIEAERRAIVATTLIAQEQLRSAQVEYARLIEVAKKLKIETRGEKGDRGDDGAP